MNHTLINADHATHTRILFVSLISSIAVTWIVIALSLSQ
jgi:hypothetical protein